MKNTLLKIGAVVGAIFGVILLIFKSNNNTKLDKKIKANKSELDVVATQVKAAIEKKKIIKKKVAASKFNAAKTKAKKKDTTSVKAKAKNFKSKYKKK